VEALDREGEEKAP